MNTRIAVLGAGAWGTALAVHLARRGDVDVVLWARDAGQARQIASQRENTRYLPGVKLAASLHITGEVGDIAAPDLLIAATPIAALADLTTRLHHTCSTIPLVWLSKGFVTKVDPTHFPSGVALAHAVFAQRWQAPVGVISGPSFAEEVAQGLPTAVAVAATQPALAHAVAGWIRADTLRAYVSEDLVGVEVGGAVKNVLAIAAGASDGLAFGNNARAALITRGLAETGRLSQALGGSRETLMGLAGLGDLVLTCTGDLSRNRRVGLGLAQGKRLPAILAELGHVAEGVTAAPAVVALARHHSVEMPICEAVHRVLHENLAPRRAVEALLKREPRAE